MKTAPLKSVAPAKASDVAFTSDQLVWHLGLEHIESGSGRVIEHYTDRAGKAGSSTHAFDENNVLYSKLRPYLNKVVCPDRPGIATTELVPLCPDPSRLDRQYLGHYLRSPRFVSWVSGQVNGAKMPRVNMKAFWEHEVPLPPLPEQKRIAAILDKADAIWRKRAESLRLTDQFLQSVFLDMFGDPVTNPKGWNECRLDEVADIASGVTKGRKFNGKRTIFVPYMRVASVQDGYLRTDIITEIEVLPEDVERYKLEAGDVLLTEGGDPDKLGRGAVWHGELRTCIHQNHIFRVRPDTQLVLSDYLSTLLGSARGKRYFLRAAKQTTGIASINMTQLRGFPVLMVPMELQETFSLTIKYKTEVVEKLQNASKHQADLFDSLVQRAFRGEL
jgi:type I restriction enzyme, S subunit